MMEDIEIAVPIEEILKILGWSRRKFFYNRKELQDAGVIFYRYEGRPPRQKIYAFPSRIKKWVGLKSAKGEKV